MSALPLKADMFSVRNDVRLVPKADLLQRADRRPSRANEVPRTHHGRALKARAQPQ